MKAQPATLKFLSPQEYHSEERITNPVFKVHYNFVQQPPNPIFIGKALSIWRKLHEELEEKGIELQKIETLTQQERTIITHIAEGLQSKEIADKLFISTHTVKTHRKNIYRKLKTNSVVDLVKISYLL